MLRAREIAHVMRVVQNCLDYGAEPDGWRYVLLEGMLDLFGAMATHAGEIVDIHDDDKAQVLHFLDIGWDDPAQRQHFIAYQIEGANRRDPVRDQFRRRRPDFVATADSRLIDMDAYRRSEIFERYMLPAGVGDKLIGMSRIGLSNRFNLVAGMRRHDEGHYSPRDLAMFRVLMIYLAPLVGTRLADSTTGTARLTIRQHRALQLILTGVSEAVAADQMGIARSTFHKYVSELFRHYDVRGRAELQALFVANGRISPWREQVADTRHARIRRESVPMAAPWRGKSTFRPLLTRPK